MQCCFWRSASVNFANDICLLFFLCVCTSFYEYEVCMCGFSEFILMDFQVVIVLAELVTWGLHVRLWFLWSNSFPLLQIPRFPRFSDCHTILLWLKVIFNWLSFCKHLCFLETYLKELRRLSMYDLLFIHRQCIFSAGSINLLYSPGNQSTFTIGTRFYVTC